MFNYMFDNTREYNEILQFITLFLLVVIGVMIYSMNDNSERIEQEISNLELKCPSCPDCPNLTCNKGECPKCPTCPVCPICPNIKNSELNNNNELPKLNNPEVVCPTVDDIVSGIFPGRNPGITKSGRYFDIQANESYELMPDYDFYEPINAFPSDSILTAPNTLLTDITSTPINNSLNNNLINTTIDSQIDTRMARASAGINTAPSNIKFGGNTEKTTELDDVQRQINAATEEDLTQPEINRAGTRQTTREENERVRRQQLASTSRSDFPNLP